MIPKLTKLRLGNFRNFAKEEVEFGNLSVLIGPNAAGKSNLLEAILFLRDLAEHGLEDAVSLRGGIDSMRNFRLPETEPIRLGFDLKWPEPKKWNRTSSHEYKERNLSYDITLSSPQSSPFIPKIEAESLKFSYELADKQESEHIEIQNFSGNISADARTRHFFFPSPHSPNETLLCQTLIPLPAFTKLMRYDIDPKLGKSALPIAGHAELDERGGNIISALRMVLDDPDDRKKLMMLVGDVLPFITEIGISPFSSMTRILWIQENCNTKNIIPSYLLSDGTIDVIALILAIYFQSAFLTLLEEPDKNLHPALIRRIAPLLVEQSEHSQFIVTTHNTELVDHVPRESVLCIARDEHGGSSVFRPNDTPKLQAFLQENIGLGQLNADGFL